MISILISLIIACSKPAPDTGSVNSCSSGETAKLLITSLSYTLPDEASAINGFDLDDFVTEVGDDEGCGHEDQLSPTGQEGIDSAWSRLAPVLDSIGASQIQDYLQTAIENGELLIIMEFTGLDGPLDSELNDDCAELTIRRANGVPLMGNDGILLEDQSVVIDHDIPPTNTVPVQFTDGLMRADALNLTLPVLLLDEYVTLILNKSSFQFEVDAFSEVSGFLAGGLPVEALVDQISEIPDIGDLQDLIPGMVGNAADLFPTSDGSCEEISIGLDFTARNVYLIE